MRVNQPLSDLAPKSARAGEDDEEDALRISLAGAQEKTALLMHEGQCCRPLGATPHCLHGRLSGTSAITRVTTPCHAALYLRTHSKRDNEYE
jgi:hypothetical protein